jgi:hypothetical protein
VRSQNGEVALEAALAAGSITSFQSISIRTPARKPVILRASPMFRGYEWYDFIRVQMLDGRICVARMLSLLCATWWGKKKVRLGYEAQGGDSSAKQLLAFVEYYPSALPIAEVQVDSGCASAAVECTTSSRAVKETRVTTGSAGQKRSTSIAASFYGHRGQPDFDARARDILHRHNQAGIPVVRLEPHPEHRYGLISTGTILGGMWVQTSYVDPRKLWAIFYDVEL